MMSFGHVSHITTSGYTMIGFQQGKYTKGLAQTTKEYSIFKNGISSIKIDRKPVHVVSK